MLEGLEATEINLDNLYHDKETRLEAEYWNRKSSIKSDRFSGEKIIDFVQYGTSEELNDFNSGYPVLRLNEFNSFFIGVPEKYSDVITQEEFQSYRLLKNDVLICRTNGNPQLVGRAALVQEDTNYAYASYLFKIRPKKNLINSATLVAFLQGRFGRNEIDAHSMVGNQTNFSPAKFKEISIPKLSEALNDLIADVFENSYEALKNAEKLYTEADTLLLRELNLANWQPAIKTNSTKTLKESFSESGRIDAEYYQPKYDEIEERIKKYKKGWGTIESLCNVKGKNFQPIDDQYYKYIELSNIGRNATISDITEYEGAELPSRARRIVETGDVIVSSVEGSLSNCAIIPESLHGAICSTGFYVINSDVINPTTLLLLFKSVIIYLMRKGCSGTILTAINNDEFYKIPIPKIEATIQTEISEKVQRSFGLQRQSKGLLEAAKTAVEIAIEQDEQAALHYLQNFEYV